MSVNMQEVQTIALYEGLTIEEAKLTYAARQKLPSSAFCGPDRSYPAHDPAHVRNAFARLATFGHRLPEGVRDRIMACLKRRAKRFGVEHEETVQSAINMWEQDEIDRLEKVEWFLKKEGLLVEEADGKPKFWIQKAIQHKGALRSQLGVKEGEEIPKGWITKIANAEVGDTVQIGGKSITVTAQLKKRAVLAKTLGKF